MARLLVGAALGVMVGMTAGAACGLHAQEAADDVQAAADEAGLDPVELAGALNSQPGVSAATYLSYLGLLASSAGSVGAGGRLPSSAGPDWPIGGALGQRIWCIEGIESRHGAAMWNPVPVGREHAQGFLGWLPSTARSVGVTIGNRWSEWQGAAAMFARGRGREFYGIAAGLC